MEKSGAQPRRTLDPALNSLPSNRDWAVALRFGQGRVAILGGVLHFLFIVPFLGEATVSGESGRSWQCATNLNRIALAPDNYRYHETCEALAVKCLSVRLAWKERSCVVSVSY